MNDVAKPEFSRPIEVGGVGALPIHRSIQANDVERAALAHRFALLALDRLEARLEVRRISAGLLAVNGHLTAKVTQTCVVTLVPVPGEIDAEFHRQFTDAPPVKQREVVLDDQFDEPDPVENGLIDLGEVVAEELALSLNPYPRAPGARFEGSDPG